MNQPDVFAKMVARLTGATPGSYAMNNNEVATLLRRHHAKVRRMIRKIGIAGPCPNCDGVDREGYVLACTDILAALDAMAGKKGTRCSR